MSDLQMVAEKQGTALDLVADSLRVSQQAALVASMHFGQRDEPAADAAAIAAMHGALGSLPIGGTVILGEGGKGAAPLLYHGETIGAGGPSVEIALNALEGSVSTAMGRNNATSVLAMVQNGTIMRVPPVYMDKIAIGPGLPDDVVDLDASVAENIHNIADAKGVKPREIIVCMLDRPHHDHLFGQAIRAGARTMAIPDGDVSAVIAAAMPDSPIDLYMGSGGAREGVLAAAALKCFGGRLRARMLFRNPDECEMADYWGIRDLKRVYRTSELVTGDIAFAATGVTEGLLLKGVRRRPEWLNTHSFVADTASGGFEFVEARHDRNSV